MILSRQGRLKTVSCLSVRAVTTTEGCGSDEVSGQPSERRKVPIGRYLASGNAVTTTEGYGSDEVSGQPSERRLLPLGLDLEQRNFIRAKRNLVARDLAAPNTP